MFNLALKSDEERQAIEHHKQACLAAHNFGRVVSGEYPAGDLSAWYRNQSQAWRKEFGAWFEASMSEATFARNQRR